MAKHCIHSTSLQPNPSFLNDALYCSEENWEDEVLDVDYFQEQEQEERESCFCGSNNNENQDFCCPVLVEQDLYWEDEELSSLFSKQEQNLLYNKLETNPSLDEARRDAVEWMLKVNAHYSFTALTSVLAVNFLDRFLFSFHLQTEKPWMIQLAAVACLSLAAKVEETQVPLLLDLQVEDSRYVFEAKTIQRMEILVLSTLQWRMNPVTPLAFLDYMIRRLGLRDHLCWKFIRRCELIILSIISDSRSLAFLPSVMATATMLHAINDIDPSLGVEYGSQLLGILGTDKERMNDCSELIMELALRCRSSQSNKRKFGSDPGSPNCVMDVSFSSDSSNDSWAVGRLSVSSSPEPPPPKKSRVLQGLNHESADHFLIIPN